MPLIRLSAVEQASVALPVAGRRTSSPGSLAGEAWSIQTQ